MKFYDSSDVLKEAYEDIQLYTVSELQHSLEHPTQQPVEQIIFLEQEEDGLLTFILNLTKEFLSFNF